MKVGDLVKIYSKDGTSSYIIGVYLGELRERFRMQTNFWVKSPVFLVGGQRKTYNKLDYTFEIVKKD